MNTIKKIFALALLITVQAQSLCAVGETTTLPNSDLRVIALAVGGTALSGAALVMVYNLINKIVETDPNLDETTLRQKVVTALRYGFGLTAGLVGVAAGVYAIVNSNKDPFISIT